MNIKLRTTYTCILSRLARHLRTGAITLLLAGCAFNPSSPPPYTISLDNAGSVWMRNARFVNGDAGPAIRGYFYQNWDPGGNVRFPGHVDLEIVNPAGSSSVWKVRAVTVSRQLRFIRLGMFQADIPSCVPPGSAIVVHYSLHQDDHLPLASCNA